MLYSNAYMLPLLLLVDLVYQVFKASTEFYSTYSMIHHCHSEGASQRPILVVENFEQFLVEWSTVADLNWNELKWMQHQIDLC